VHPHDLSILGNFELQTMHLCLLYYGWG
jgi:hypothetical protein